MRQQLVIVGAGPRGTGILERLAANAPALYGGPGLDIHLVDLHPPGGGRIWRQEQSPLLWMNSYAEDVTMFTDETVAMTGPVREGPTLHEWAGLHGRTFADRQLQGRYLAWVYDRTLAELPPDVTVHHHPRRALRISGPREGRQQVWLEGRPRPLLADLVVLAVGHLDGELDAEQARLAAYARENGLVHLPPDFTADSDLSALKPGEPVLVRGFGLAFVDLMVLLTEGRGGRYEAERYLPSGREPVLYVGSRRGVPYHSKIGYDWTGDRPPLPRFLGPAEVDELLARPGGFDFRRDVWPLVEKELGFAQYHRLFTAHPGRTTMAWADNGGRRRRCWALRGRSGPGRSWRRCCEGADRGRGARGEAVPGTAGWRSGEGRGADVSARYGGGLDFVTLDDSFTRPGPDALGVPGGARDPADRSGADGHHRSPRALPGAGRRRRPGRLEAVAREARGDGLGALRAARADRDALDRGPSRGSTSGHSRELAGR
jgi:hypothetical protein